MTRGFPRWLMAALLMVPLQSLAQASAESVAAPTTVADARPRTCLVLGGGGARGAAHIGLLKVLERERIPVDCIVGTSMGAIVGGLYATGYTADEIEAVLDRIDWNAVLRDKPPRNERSMRRKEDDLRLLGGAEVGLRDGKISFPRGIIQGQKLEMLLRRLLLPAWEVQDFDDLPIPFRAIATDIVTGEKVVFEQGDLAMAIRASMSVPGVFAPVRVDGRLLVDGGVVDNVPIDEPRKLGGQRLIVSRVGSPLMTEEQLSSPLAISHQMANVLMKKEVEAQIATLGTEDLLITPALGDMGSQDFNRSPQAVAVGQQAAEQSLAALQRYRVDEDAYARFAQRHRPPAYEAPIVAFVDVVRGGTRTARYVEQRMAQHVGKPLDVPQVERQLANAYGEGRYEQLQWRLAEREGRHGIVVAPQDKHWGPDFIHFALRLSDDFDGYSNYQLIAEMTRTGLSEQGGELKFRLGLGEVEELFAEWYQPMGARGRHAVSAYADYRATDQDLALYGHGAFAQLRYSQWLGGLRCVFAASGLGGRIVRGARPGAAAPGRGRSVGAGQLSRLARQPGRAAPARFDRQLRIPAPRTSSLADPPAVPVLTGIGHRRQRQSAAVGRGVVARREPLAGRVASQFVARWGCIVGHLRVPRWAGKPVGLSGGGHLRAADCTGAHGLLPPRGACRLTAVDSGLSGRKPGVGRLLAPS
ncbi:patatin-like phospholipase family protein [Pseudoxanthomonas sp. SL93]|uniref:patatin-like phospholipase family protein n=1 Tax=Pseudoxanthomonas sp. SL93 TaxID=2995142 RepID=UPI002271A1C2|nr:patatin-like phospholipase family protein [Pseudoxanthomonas sp. SL93]WAC63793.1 patatin-like phospholipase family protein [Pseudoxanthomonas sp. SL93]